MLLLVGLGNPGPRYAETRHNVGFRIADRFAERHAIALDEGFGGLYGRGPVRAPDGAEHDVAVLEPLTYMNLSGDSVAAALRKLPVEDLSRELLVVFDDVDLPFGRLRLRGRGGAGGHRGLTHIIERLGHGDFPRLRFGVGRPPDGMETSDYVLEPFAPDEQAELDERVRAAAEAVEAALFEGVERAMNRVNRDPAPAPEPQDDAGSDPETEKAELR